MGSVKFSLAYQIKTLFITKMLFRVGKVTVQIQGSINSFGPVTTSQSETSVQFVTSHGANFLSYVGQLTSLRKAHYLYYYTILNKNLISLAKLLPLLNKCTTVDLTTNIINIFPLSFRSPSSCERGDDGDWRCRDVDHFERFHRLEGQGNQRQASKTSYVKELQDSDRKSQDNPNSSMPGHPTAGVTEKEDMGSRDIGSGDRGSIQDLKGEQVSSDKKGMLALEGNTVSSSHVSCEM